MKNRISHFWTTRPDVMMVTLSLERETHYLRGRFFPLWRKYSLQQQIVFSWLFVVSLVMEAMGLPSPFFLFYALVDLFFFVSLILTCLYLYVYPRSKLERKEIVSVTGISYSSLSKSFLKISNKNVSYSILEIKKDIDNISVDDISKFGPNVQRYSKYCEGIKYTSQSSV